jgi:hypothetical protein
MDLLKALSNITGKLSREIGQIAGREPIEMVLPEGVVLRVPSSEISIVLKALRGAASLRQSTRRIGLLPIQRQKRLCTLAASVLSLGRLGTYKDIVAPPRKAIAGGY